jgi:hypothetical protein
MPKIPRGIPSVTYCRIIPPLGGSQIRNDLTADGNTIVVVDPSQTTSRHEVAQVLERGSLS